MADYNIIYCGMLLKGVRAEAKDMRVDVSGLTTYCTEIGITKHYQVFKNGTGTVWSGVASCASEAKFKYISNLLDVEIDKLTLQR